MEFIYYFVLHLGLSTEEELDLLNVLTLDIMENIRAEYLQVYKDKAKEKKH